MDAKEARAFVCDLTSMLEAAGNAGSAIAAHGKAVKSWMSWNDVEVPRRERRIVAMDETVVKLQGRSVYVWGAIDVDTEELLAVYASYQRAYVNTMEFARRVLRTWPNRPVVLVDVGRGIRGPWRGWG